MAVRLARRWNDDQPEVCQEILPGRHADLASLTRAVAEARTGRGSVVIIEGPAGIGRSRLLAEAEARATDEHMDLLVATCSVKEQGFHLGVALQLFEDRLAQAGAVERGGLLSGPARLAVPLLTEGPRATISEGEPFLHGLYWLCRHLADRRPVAICVDDVHLADPSSLRLFLYLARRLADLPIALILTARSGSRDPSGGIIEAIAGCPVSRVMRLEPLGLDAVVRLLAQRPRVIATEKLGRACLEVTGGNPFLLSELVEELSARSGQTARVTAGDIRGLGPPAIARAATTQMAALGESAREVARAVSVLGDDSELRHAAALARIGDAEAAEGASMLMDAQVLHRRERLTFVHPVIGRALYLALAPTERGKAHRRAASLLADEGAAADLVGDQLLEAICLGDPSVVELLRTAAHEAVVAARPEAAVRYLRRALEEPPEASQRPAVLLELGRCEALAGEPNAAARLTEALGLVDAPHQRAAATLEVARILYARGHEDEAIAALEACAAHIDDGDLRLHLQVSLRVANRLALRKGSQVPPMNASAFESAPEGSPSKRLLLAEQAGRRALRGDPCGDVSGLALRALDGDALLRDETADGLGYYLAASALTLTESFDLAEPALTAAVEEARARASVLGLATASYFQSFAALRRGHIPLAAAAAQTALDGRRYGWRLALPGAHALLAETMMERGTLEDAASELAAGGADDTGLAGLPGCLYLAARARLALLGGDAERALADYLECGRRLQAAGAANPAVVAWRTGAARAMAQLGDGSEASRLAEEELGLARDFGAPGPVGRALHAIGLVQAGDGLEALENAVDVLEASQASLDRARALVDYGGALRRAGKRRDARGPLRLGLDIATRCGAEVLAKRALEEAVAAGSRPRRTATSGIDSLTARERQVVELAARGKSNREISDALVVTLKTVEWHLRHAYAKLEIRSRADLRRILDAGVTVG